MLTYLHSVCFTSDSKSTCCNLPVQSLFYEIVSRVDFHLAALQQFSRHQGCQRQARQEVQHVLHLYVEQLPGTNEEF